MLTFIVRRLVQLVPVGLGVTIVSFLLVRLVPGDPALTLLGNYATPDLVAQVHQQLGLDKPIVAQYIIFLGNLLHGDLGHSYFYGEAVTRLLFQRLGVTLLLAAFAVLLSVLLAVPLALLAALRRESWWDRAVRVLLILGNGLPGYWVGIIFILIFGLSLHLFPVGGYGDTPVGHVRALFLPALTVSIGVVPTLVRSLRASLIEALRADYVRTARAKGLAEGTVLVRHAVRTALIPAVTLLGVNIGFMVGGLVVIEAVFGIPGVGQLLINAITTRDYPVVQGAVLLFAILVVLVNLATDIVNRLLDPRLWAAPR